MERSEPEMAEQRDFQVLFSKLAEVREDPEGGELQIRIEYLHQQGDAISELMDAATELAQPQPIFFTRG
jgi:hypothetical protein